VDPLEGLEEGETLLLLAAFADAFGTSVANPPSTPK